MVVAHDLPGTGGRAVSPKIAVLYGDARCGAAILERLAGADLSISLAPMETAPGQGTDADMSVLVGGGGATEFVDACRSLRERTAHPIVAIVKKQGEQVITSLLEAGADEVLPFSIGERELTARVNAMVRRYVPRTPQAWAAGNLTINPGELSVDVEGKRVFLTPIEFRLLACLASAPGKAFTHETLMSRVWGAEYVDARHYLYLYIRYLREKLETDPSAPKLIVSEWGVGYRLEPQAT